MKTLTIVLIVFLMSAFVCSVMAHDYTFEEPNWGYYWTDPPKWHYEGDAGNTGGYYINQCLYSIELELVFSENTLTEGNAIQMWFHSDFWDGEYSWWDDNYFDIPPNVNQLTVELPIDSWSEYLILETHTMTELNTVPDGGGYVVIDEANSWFDRFYLQGGVESMSVGRIKFLEK